MACKKNLLNISPKKFCSRKLCSRTSPNFLCMLHVAIARSSSDSVAIHCVVPVLRMSVFTFSYCGTSGPESRTTVVVSCQGPFVTGELSHRYTMLPKEGKVTGFLGKITRSYHFDPSI